MKKMKKQIIITAIIAVVAIVACVGFNINVSKRATTLSMKNIEALALGEGGSGYNNAKSIYCVMPAGKIGCISQVARQCYDNVFCTH